MCCCERGPARNRELQYYHFIHGHNDSQCWMLYGASTTLLMAELTLFRLEIQSMHPRFKAWSATRPTLAPDGLAQICCNLCTAVVCWTAAPLSAGQGVTADLVSDKANLVIRQCCMQDLNGTDKTSFFIALCCFLFFQIHCPLLLVVLLLVPHLNSNQCVD